MPFAHILPDQLQQLLTEQSVTLVDIRAPQSFQAGSLPGALHLSRDNFDEFLAQADFQAPLVVICYHGNSSQATADFLNQQGFSTTYSLDGGFELWQQSVPPQAN